MDNRCDHNGGPTEAPVGEFDRWACPKCHLLFEAVSPYMVRWSGLPTYAVEDIEQLGIYVWKATI